MADSSTRVTNFPDSGSPARVAFDMTKYMIKLLPEARPSEDRIKDILDLYADCYDAASGYRKTTRK